MTREPTTSAVSTAPIADGRPIAYAEYGDSGGTPVVFLHGTPGSRHLGELFHAVAQEQGVRLLAPDRPGYGRSPPWPDRAIDDAATFITAVLDDAGVDTAGIVGFSGGSAHALAATATHPDRFTRVDSIAGATPPSVTEETPTPQRLLSGLATRTPRVLGGLFRGQAWVAARLDPSFVVNQYATDPDSVPLDVQETVKADFLEAFATSPSATITEFRNAATAWEVPFGDIDTELQFWHGDADTNVPIASAKRLSETIPTANLRVVSDADHLDTLLEAMPDVLAVQSE